MQVFLAKPGSSQEDQSSAEGLDRNMHGPKLFDFVALVSDCFANHNLYTCYKLLEQQRLGQIIKLLYYILKVLFQALKVLKFLS